MSDALLPWLEEYRLSHRPESHAPMSHTLNEFHGWCRKNIIARITRSICCATGMAHRPEAQPAHRCQQDASREPVHPQRAQVRRRQGTGDGKFTEGEPTVYNDVELEAFFKECDAYR